MLIALTLWLVNPGNSFSQVESATEPEPFLVFDGTQSPNGRYAVAWGLPKHPDVWAKVRQFNRTHPVNDDLTDEESKQAREVFQSVDDVAQDVENYIVDLRDRKIIRKLDCPRMPGVTADRELEPEYWFAGLRPNRHDLEVTWSRSNNLVLVNHTYRWDCVTFCAVPIHDGQSGPPLDLNIKLVNAVRNFVAKSFPRGSSYSKKDLNVSFSEIKQLRDTKFAAHAEAVIGKEWSSDGANVEFEITPSRPNTVALKVLSVK